MASDTQVKMICAKATRALAALRQVSGAFWNPSVVTDKGATAQAISDAERELQAIIDMCEPKR